MENKLYKYLYNPFSLFFAVVIVGTSLFVYWDKGYQCPPGGFICLRPIFFLPIFLGGVLFSTILYVVLGLLKIKRGLRFLLVLVGFFPSCYLSGLSLAIYDTHVLERMRQADKVAHQICEERYSDYKRNLAITDFQIFPKFGSEGTAKTYVFNFTMVSAKSLKFKMYPKLVFDKYRTIFTVKDSGWFTLDEYTPKNFSLELTDSNVSNLPAGSDRSDVTLASEIIFLFKDETNSLYPIIFFNSQGGPYLDCVSYGIFSQVPEVDVRALKVDKYDLRGL